MKSSAHSPASRQLIAQFPTYARSRRESLSAKLEAATARAKAALKSRLDVVQDTLAKAKLLRTVRPASSLSNVPSSTDSALTKLDSSSPVATLAPCHTSFALRLISNWVQSLSSDSFIATGRFDHSVYAACHVLSSVKLPVFLVPFLETVNPPIVDSEWQYWPRSLEEAAGDSQYAAFISDESALNDLDSDSSDVHSEMAQILASTDSFLVDTQLEQELQAALLSFNIKSSTISYCSPSSSSLRLPNALYHSTLNLMRSNVFFSSELPHSRSISSLSLEEAMLGVRFSPFVPLCRFDLQGKCSDDSCTFTHIRAPAKSEEILQSAQRAYRNSDGSLRSKRISELASMNAGLSIQEFLNPSVPPPLNPMRAPASLAHSSAAADIALQSGSQPESEATDIVLKKLVNKSVADDIAPSLMFDSSESDDEDEMEQKASQNVEVSTSMLSTQETEPAEDGAAAASSQVASLGSKRRLSDNQQSSLTKRAKPSAAIVTTELGVGFNHQAWKAKIGSSPASAELWVDYALAAVEHHQHHPETALTEALAIVSQGLELHTSSELVDCVVK